MLIENIQINDPDYHSVLAGIGYPALDEDSIYTIISKEQIEELIIEPSLEDYYKFFPVRSTIDVSSAGSGAVNSFDCTTISGVITPIIGIIKMQFISQTSSTPGQSIMDAGSFYQNPFFSASQIYSMGGSNFGVGSTYGTPYGYGQESIVYLKRFFAKSIESSNKVYWYKFDKNRNLLYYKSNISGRFVFDVASVDPNIDNIQFDKKRSFLNYCKGKLKCHVAETLSLIELDLPATLNADALQDKGEKLIEDELTYWRESSSFFGLR
jgi:hypothetical protein